MLDYLPPRVCAITNNPRRLPAIRVHLFGLMTSALVDSCASVSYCRESVARKAGLKIVNLGENTKLTAANDSSIRILGKVNAKLRIEDEYTGEVGEWEANLLVSPDKHCPGPFLIGLPLLTELKGVISLGDRKVRLGEIWTNIVSVISSDSIPKTLRVTMRNTEILEPRTETILIANIDRHFEADEFFW